MSKFRKKLLSVIMYFFLTILFIIIGFTAYFIFALKIEKPKIIDTSANNLEKTKINDSTYVIGNNWIRKNENGLWEMYVEGNDYELGIINGKLSKDLIYKQEKAFTNEIKKIIPSKYFLRTLKYFIVWFNRDITKYIKEEYVREIYGVSKSASTEFNFIGPRYYRILNYHAAHDIGHALQDMKIVGCTSFSVWDEASKDSNLLVGRNFDFYVGDEFSEEKIICFYNPDKGLKFMFVTWGGMIGAVSGMNEAGITVTINGATSDIPTQSATPISLVVREILQYAKNIDDAYNIAAKRKLFVSSSLLVGSAKDNKTVIIEKSPEKIGFYEVDDNKIRCTNHLQSDAFKNDEKNIDNIKTSSSSYRYQRLDELMKQNTQMDHLDFAEILRDRKGLNGAHIGLGNEKAINQLLAHHGIIFKPAEQIVWVSSNPYNMGEFQAYDLNKVFNANYTDSITVDSLKINKDPFLSTDEYKGFVKFKEMTQVLNEKKREKTQNISIDESFINKYIQTNKNFFITYKNLGDYFFEKGSFTEAKKYYELSLQQVISSEYEKDGIINRINKCEKKLNS